ncbi:MAG: DUF4126 family protein [Gemmatimonadota bacterium]
MTEAATHLPPELLLVPGLTLASGLNLYLVLLALGAAARLGAWGPLPGDLAYLGAPYVLGLMGALYVLEFTVQRRPRPGVLWAGLNLPVRALAGALLPLLVLPGASAQVKAGACLAAAILAVLAALSRWGSEAARLLTGSGGVRPVTYALFLDATALALVSVSLDYPAVGAGGAFLAATAVLPFLPRWSRALAWAVRCLRRELLSAAEGGRWTSASRMNRRVLQAVRQAMAGEAEELVGLRGTAAAALNLPGVPPFRQGWILTWGDHAVFLPRPGRKSKRDGAAIVALNTGSGAWELGARRVCPSLALGPAGAPRLFLDPRGPDPRRVLQVLGVPEPAGRSG